MIKSTIKRVIQSLGYDIRKTETAPGTLYQIDNWFIRRYMDAQFYTGMTSTDNELRRQRHYVLNHLLHNVDFSSGDVCEAGCWKGLSAYQIASFIQKRKEKVRFHIFDSFEGLSEIQSQDRSEFDERNPEEVRKQFACPQDMVQNNLKAFDFIEYHKGWIPDRFDDVSDRTFCFVHIDVDLYQPIYDSFCFFYPRMAQDGIMVFDDYGCLQFPGAQKAVDQCLKEHGNPFFVPLPSGQAFLVRKN